MLRHLAEGRHWPASRVNAGAEGAVHAALRAPGRPSRVPDSVDGVNLLLKGCYEAAHRKRDAGLRAVHREIILRAREGEETASLISQISPAGAPGEFAGESRIALLLEALESRLARRPEAQDAGEPTDWTAKFLLEEARLLISELSEGAGDGFAEETPDGSAAVDDSRLQLLSNHLANYSGREGSFARLLYGQTPPKPDASFKPPSIAKAHGPWCWSHSRLSGARGLTFTRSAAPSSSSTRSGIPASSSNRSAGWIARTAAS